MTEKLLDGSPDLEQAKKEKKKLEKLKLEEVSALFWKLLQPYLSENAELRIPYKWRSYNNHC